MELLTLNTGQWIACLLMVAVILAFGILTVSFLLKGTNKNLKK